MLFCTKTYRMVHRSNGVKSYARGAHALYEAMADTVCTVRANTPISVLRIDRSARTTSTKSEVRTRMDVIQLHRFKTR